MDDEDSKMDEYKLIQDHLLDYPYDYEKHLKLIGIADELKDLQLRRKSRENMASKFPLSPSLWIDWINFEKDICESEEDRKCVTELFERALKDYVSVQLWLAYISFVMTGGESSLTATREILDKAIVSVGLNAAEGTLIWVAYRKFEAGMIESISQDSEKTHQYEKIFDLFKRHLSIPHIGMEETYIEFHAWFEKISTSCSSLDSSSVKYGYEKARQQLLKLQPFEEELTTTEAPHFQAYLKYIEFEETNGTPARVQCIYERALVENPLQPELWIKYTKYYDDKIKDLSQVSPIHERAIRNCTWTVSIWTNYLCSLERNKADPKIVLDIFSKSLVVSFQSGKEYLSLWLVYLDYLRRRTDWNSEEEIANLKKNFVRATEHLNTIEDGDDSCTIPLYMAIIEAKYLKNTGEARRIWNEILQSRKDLTAKVSTWIDFVNFEKIYGQKVDVRKALIKGINSNVEYPEAVGELLIRFIREESDSIDEVDEVMKIYEKAMAKVASKREEQNKKKLEEKPKAKETASGKRKRTTEPGDKSLKSSQPPGKLAKSSETDGEINKGIIQMSANAVKDEKILNEIKRQMAFKEKGDEKTLNTIVIKNLKYSVTEDKLKEVFSQFGEITDTRLVRNYKGQSAGYAFIEFDRVSSAQEAVKNDRLPIEDRPCYIDGMGKKNAPQFSTSRENNKLFISNLDKQATREQLDSIFGIYGKIKDIRIGTAKNGKPKGYAYIEYHNEKDASEALVANGTLVNEKPIKVQISDPSAKGSNNKQESKFLGSGLLQSSTSSSTARQRINVPTSMIPPTVRRKMMADQKQNLS